MISDRSKMATTLLKWSTIGEFVILGIVVALAPFWIAPFSLDGLKPRTSAPGPAVVPAPSNVFLLINSYWLVLEMLPDFEKSRPTAEFRL